VRRRGRHFPRRLRGREPRQPHPPEFQRDLEFLFGRIELECVEQLVELQLQFEQFELELLELEQLVQQFQPVEQFEQLLERLLRRPQVRAFDPGWRRQQSPWVAGLAAQASRLWPG